MHPLRKQTLLLVAMTLTIVSASVAHAQGDAVYYYEYRSQGTPDVAERTIDRVDVGSVWRLDPQTGFNDLVSRSTRPSSSQLYGSLWSWPAPGAAIHMLNDRGRLYRVAGNGALVEYLGRFSGPDFYANPATLVQLTDGRLVAGSWVLDPVAGISTQTTYNIHPQAYDPTTNRVWSATDEGIAEFHALTGATTGNFIPISDTGWENSRQWFYAIPYPGGGFVAQTEASSRRMAAYYVDPSGNLTGLRGTDPADDITVVFVSADGVIVAVTDDDVASTTTTAHLFAPTGYIYWSFNWPNWGQLAPFRDGFAILFGKQTWSSNSDSQITEFRGIDVWDANLNPSYQPTSWVHESDLDLDQRGEGAPFGVGGPHLMRGSADNELLHLSSGGLALIDIPTGNRTLLSESSYNARAATTAPIMPLAGNQRPPSPQEYVNKFTFDIEFPSDRITPDRNSNGRIEAGDLTRRVDEMNALP